MNNILIWIGLIVGVYLLIKLNFKYQKWICKRKGHDIKTRTEYGLSYPGTGYRTVADEVSRSQNCCGRCWETLTEWSEPKREGGLSGITLDSDKMRKLKKEGILWNES